jgi:hypothetical protein
MKSPRTIKSKDFKDTDLAYRRLWQDIAAAIATSGAFEDHGTLNGLADDDHTQYLLADGSRACTGIFTTKSGRVKNTSRYTTTANILVTDDQVYCNGTFTVTLPTGVDGQTFRIINSGTGTITITSAENILGSAEDVILNAGDVVILTFETTENWW